MFVRYDTALLMFMVGTLLGFLIGVPLGGWVQNTFIKRRYLLVRWSEVPQDLLNRVMPRRSEVKRNVYVFPDRSGRANRL